MIKPALLRKLVHISIMKYGKAGQNKRHILRLFKKNEQTLVQEVGIRVQKCFDTEPCFSFLGV